MVGSRTVLMFVLGLGMAGASSAPVMAQQGGGGGVRQRFDPAAMRERMQQRVKESLGVTDEEWTALQPKIEKVQQDQMAIRAAGMAARSFRGGPGGGNAFRPDNAAQSSPVAVAASELRDTLDNKESTPDQIKAKLQAFRDAKAKAAADLAAAQAELKDLLTARQEAVLVSQGILD